MYETCWLTVWDGSAGASLVPGGGVQSGRGTLGIKAVVTTFHCASFEDVRSSLAVVRAIETHPRCDGDQTQQGVF